MSGKHKRIVTIPSGRIQSLTMRPPRGVSTPFLQQIHSLAPRNGFLLQSHVNWGRTSSFTLGRIHPHTVAVAHPFSTSTDSIHPILTLYQYQICPYCNIAKTLLNYTNTPYQPIEVNPLTKAELKTTLLPDKQYKKVPILTSASNNSSMLGNEEKHKMAVPLVQQFNGSESIVEHLLSAFATPSEIDSTSPSAVQWSDWGRNELVPLLYPNLCNTLANSYQAFGYVHATNTPFSLLQRYSIQWVGSIAMYLAASKIKSECAFFLVLPFFLNKIGNFQNSRLILPCAFFFTSRFQKRKTQHYG